MSNGDNPAAAAAAKLAALVAMVGLLREAGVEMPTREELLAEVRAAAERVATEAGHWLTNREAAAYTRTALRTWERKKKQFGIPHADHFGSPKYWRPDLDALLLKGLTKPPGPTVLDFPSLHPRPATAAA